MQISDTGIDYFRVMAEHLHHKCTGWIKQCTYNNTASDRQNHGCANAFLNTVLVARSDILTSIGSQCVRQALYRQECEGIDLVCTVESCHKVGTIAVNQRLHEHDTDGKQCLLDTRWNTQLHCLHKQVFLEIEFLWLDLDKIITAVNICLLYTSLWSAPADTFLLSLSKACNLP